MMNRCGVGVIVLLISVVLVNIFVTNEHTFPDKSKPHSNIRSQSQEAFGLDISKAAMKDGKYIHVDTVKRAWTRMSENFTALPKWNRTEAFSMAWGHMTASWNASLSYTSNITHPDKRYKAHCWEELVTIDKLKSAYKKNYYCKIREPKHVRHDI